MKAILDWRDFIMRKWLLIALVVICIPLTLIGCVPTATNPAATTPAVSPIQELQTWKANIDTWKTTIADPAIAKINAPQPAVTANAQLTADMESVKVTIPELSKKITELTTRVTDDENQITALKNNVGSYSNNNGSSTGGTTGNVPQFTPGSNPGAITTSASGGVVSQYAFVSGQSQIWSSPSGGSGTCWYIQRLINTSTAIQYIHPTINLGQSTQYGQGANGFFTGLNINISSTQGSLQGTYNPTAWNYPTVAWPLVGSSNVVYATIGTTQNNTVGTNYPPTGTMTYSLLPGLGQMTTSIIIMPSSGLTNNSGTVYLYPGQYIDITVQMQGVYTSTASMWNISPSFLAST